MGIDPLLLANSTSACLSQRLVRQLCPRCKKPVIPDSATVERFQALGHPLPEGDFFDALGCPNCDGEGYVGRIAIAELLKVDDLLRRRLCEPVPVATLREHLAAHGMITLVEDGIRRAQAGETSLHELLRVVG
jgi:general secretion pathway protein E